MEHKAFAFKIPTDEWLLDFAIYRDILTQFSFALFGDVLVAGRAVAPPKEADNDD